MSKKDYWNYCKTLVEAENDPFSFTELEPSEKKNGKDSYKSRKSFNSNNRKRIEAEQKHNGHNGVVIKQTKRKLNLNNGDNLSTIREGNPETSDSVKRKLEWEEVESDRAASRT